MTTTTRSTRRTAAIWDLDGTQPDHRPRLGRCQDSGEDTDDDNDGVLDPTTADGRAGRISSPSTTTTRTGARTAERHRRRQRRCVDIPTPAAPGRSTTTNSTTDNDGDGCSTPTTSCTSSPYIGRTSNRGGVPARRVRGFYGVFNRPSLTLGDHTVNLSGGVAPGSSPIWRRTVRGTGCSPSTTPPIKIPTTMPARGR